MESLKSICRNWGNKECHPDVSKWSSDIEIKEGEEPIIFPVGEELKKLDEICKKCKSRFFITDEGKCPLCDSLDVERTGGSHSAKGWATAYGFKCNECGEKFWIYKTDLKP